MLFPEKTEFKKRISKQKFYTNMEITSNLKKGFCGADKDNLLAK